MAFETKQKGRASSVCLGLSSFIWLTISLNFQEQPHTIRQLVSGIKLMHKGTFGNPKLPIHPPPPPPPFKVYTGTSTQTVLPTPFFLSISDYRLPMDPDAFTTTSIFKWDPRTILSASTLNRPPLVEYTMAPPAPAPAALVRGPRELGGLDELFQAYGIRYYTAAKIAELGFTVSTLVNMKDEELDEMMNSLSQIFRWDLLVGERYGIKAAVRAERRRIDDEDTRRRNLHSADTTTTNTTNALDALSQEGACT